jgi:colanic acid/amylovoran biosynthesis protein
MNPLLIYGSATHDNAGDLAMMQALIDRIRRDLPALSLALLTRNPEPSAARFGIPCHPSHDPWLIAPHLPSPSRTRLVAAGLLFLLRLILWQHGPRRLADRLTPPGLRDAFTRLATCHGILVHGSGSFNSIFRRGWLYPKTFTALAARRLGRPVWMTSQGIGPFDHPLDRFIARLFFHTAAFTGLRDEEPSRSTALACGAPPERIVFTGDDALRLAPAHPGTVDAAWIAEGLPTGQSLLGLNVRNASSYHPGYRDGGDAALAAALDRIIEQRNAHIVFLPITYDPHDDDRTSAHAVRAHMRHPDHAWIVEGHYPPAVLRALIARMQAAAGVSYHFLLFALDAGRPALALTRNTYYAAKHQGLLDLYAPALATAPWTETATDALTTALLALLDQPESLRHTLHRQNQQIANRAEQGMQHLHHLVQQSKG